MANLIRVLDHLGIGLLRSLKNSPPNTFSPLFSLVTNQSTSFWLACPHLLSLLAYSGIPSHSSFFLLLTPTPSSGDLILSHMICSVLSVYSQINPSIPLVVGLKLIFKFYLLLSIESRRGSSILLELSSISRLFDTCNNTLLLWQSCCLLSILIAII